MLPNPRFSGAAKKASCDRQLAHFRPVFTRIPADPPHQYLMRVAPLERAEHVIEAETASKRIASQLKINEGDPLLVLTRRTWSRGQVASFVRLIHPASRYRFVGIFQVGAPLAS